MHRASVVLWVLWFLASVAGCGSPGSTATSASSVSNTVSVLRNTGNGTFATRVDYATGLEPYAVAAADFNGDGRPDLATASLLSFSVSVLLNSCLP